MQSDREENIKNIKSFGWLLFLAGIALLAWAALIGIDTGYGRVTNIAAMGIGIGAIVSGAIFIGVGMILGQIEYLGNEILRIMGVPSEKNAQNGKNGFIGKKTITRGGSQKDSLDL